MLNNMLSSSIKNYGLVCFAILLASCGKKPVAQGPPPVAVVAQRVALTSAPYFDEYPGTVVALNQIELRPQVNGYITGIHFHEGDHVKKGQLLYSIDRQQYEAAYQQTVANLEVYQANLVKAQKDVNRYRELAKSDAIAKQQVDNAEANYQAALKQVDAAKATVQSVQTNVRYTSITAPFDGTIGLSQVRMGAAVSAGQTVINTVSSDDPIAVDISIDQKEISRFVTIQHKTNIVNDSSLRLTVSGVRYPHPGKLAFMDRAVNAQTGTIIVRFEFSNSGNVLRPGMPCTLIVLNNSAQQAVVIPYKAVTEQLGEYFVYVADSNKVTQQKVLVGKAIGKNVIIKEGLHEGDTIVTEGVQNLREGSAISIAKAGQGQKK